MLVKHLKLMQNHEDFELKKLLVNILVTLSKDSTTLPVGFRHLLTFAVQENLTLSLSHIIRNLVLYKVYDQLRPKPAWSESKAPKRPSFMYTAVIIEKSCYLSCK